MTVYVDDAKNPYGYLVMSHMIADTKSELDEMAEKLELKQVYKENVGERNEHFDISQSFVKRAVRKGAKRITQKELVRILQTRDLKKYLES